MMLPLFGSPLITVRIKNKTGETAEKRIAWIQARLGSLNIWGRILNERGHGETLDRKRG